MRTRAPATVRNHQLAPNLRGVAPFNHKSKVDKSMKYHLLDFVLLRKVHPLRFRDAVALACYEQGLLDPYVDAVIAPGTSGTETDDRRLTMRDAAQLEQISPQRALPQTVSLIFRLWDAGTVERFPTPVALSVTAEEACRLGGVLREGDRAVAVDLTASTVPRSPEAGEAVVEARARTQAMATRLLAEAHGWDAEPSMGLGTYERYLFADSVEAAEFLHAEGIAVPEA